MLLETITRLELLLQAPDARSNADRLAELLHPAFREVGCSGTTYTRDEILAHLTGAALQPIIWSQDFALEMLADDLALLTYRSAHVGENGELRRHACRSSLWQRTAGGWRLRFHQGTPTAGFIRHTD